MMDEGVEQGLDWWRNAYRADPEYTKKLYEDATVSDIYQHV